MSVVSAKSDDTKVKKHQTKQSKSGKSTKDEQRAKIRDGVKALLARKPMQEELEFGERVVFTLVSPEIGDISVTLGEMLSVLQAISQSTPNISQQEAIQRAGLYIAEQRAKLHIIENECKSNVETDPRYKELVKKQTEEAIKNAKLAVWNAQRREQCSESELVEFINQHETSQREKGERLFDVRVFVYTSKSDAENAMQLLQSGTTRDMVLDSKEQKDAAESLQTKFAGVGGLIDAGGRVKYNKDYSRLVREDGLLDYEHPFFAEVWSELSNYKGDAYGYVGPVKFTFNENIYYFVVQVVSVAEYSICPTEKSLAKLLDEFLYNKSPTAERITAMARKCELKPK